VSSKQLAAVIGFLLMATPAFADSVSVKPDQTVLGRPVTLTITVELEPGESVIPPGGFKAPEGIEVLATAATEPQLRPDKSGVQTFTATLVPFILGDVIIEKIEYGVASQDGSVEKRTIEKVGFIVNSIREKTPSDQDAETLKPLRPLAKIPIRWREFLIPVLILLAGITAGALAWRWWSRYQARRAAMPTPPPPPRPADEVAFERLAQLKQKQESDDRLNPKGFSFTLSEIVREYLEKRFGVLALERTTIELKSEITSSLTGEAPRQKIISLLERCDAVKYARQGALADTEAQLIRDAEGVVIETRTVETVEERS
jgi:hypothetical protein